MPSKARVIYWFRTDLRLHDSPALKAALDLEPECLWPIWCWDPHYVYRVRVGPNRWKFLTDCQSDLSSSITKLNSKSKLFLMREAPQTLLPKLFKAWRPSHLVFEKDTDPYAKERDEIVQKLAKEAGIEVIMGQGRTLYDSDELVKANGGKPTMSIKQVQQAGSKIGDLPRPIPAPKSLPDPGETNLDFDQEQPSSDPDINSTQRNSDDKSYSKLAGPNGDFDVPTLEELGMKPALTKHKGGETVALKILDELTSDEEYTATFEKPKTAPTAFNPQATTLLSAYLHFGALSCREFYWRAQDIVDKWKSKASQPPASLTGQLLFRDMYFGAQASLGTHFGQTVGNDHCKFIPWHLRSVIDEKTGLSTKEYVKDSAEAEEWFRRWKFGVTGFPWIDAAMRQLRQEGWIHHLARHAVACFLTRGGCYIDWERGAEVFEEWLIDHEPACNVGNWQWLSCTAFFSQFYRCYSPISFPQKTDKQGDFVRHYVPELEDFPQKYIYEPWKAPIQDQKKAGCRIQGDGTQSEVDGLKVYPKPMFNFAERREICIQGMKSAYKIGLKGNDPKVKDGSWRSLFEDDAEGPTEGKSDKEAYKKSKETGKEWEMDDDNLHMEFGDEDADVADGDRGKHEGKKETKRKRGVSKGTMDAHVTRKSKR